MATSHRGEPVQAWCRTHVHLRFVFTNYLACCAVLGICSVLSEIKWQAVSQFPAACTRSVHRPHGF